MLVDCILKEIKKIKRKLMDLTRLKRLSVSKALHKMTVFVDSLKVCGSHQILDGSARYCKMSKEAFALIMVTLILI